MSVTILNLTPHNVHIKCEDGVINIFQASGQVARVSSNQRKTKTIVAHSKQSVFAVFANEFDEVYVEDSQAGKAPMPEQQDGVYYIVSSFVAQALPHRTDLICPNSTDAVRNEKGHIMHTNGFMLP